MERLSITSTCELRVHAVRCKFVSAKRVINGSQQMRNKIGKVPAKFPYTITQIRQRYRASRNNLLHQTMKDEITFTSTNGYYYLPETWRVSVL